jgi:hypothetical protein
MVVKKGEEKKKEGKSPKDATDHPISQYDDGTHGMFL